MWPLRIVISGGSCFGSAHRFSGALSRTLFGKGTPMKKFLVLYRAPVAAFEQMKKSSPEQQKAGMDAWMAWSTKAAASIVDMGAPLGKSLRVSPGGATRPERPRRILNSARRVEGRARRDAQGTSSLHDAGRLYRGCRVDADAGCVRRPWKLDGDGCEDSESHAMHRPLLIALEVTPKISAARPHGQWFAASRTILASD